MAKKGKLRAALDSYKGVDYKLEKQKKFQKQADKRKRVQSEQKAKELEEEEIDEEAEDQLKREIESQQDQASDSDDDEEGGVPLDLEGIDDTDSSGDEMEEEAEVVANGAEDDAEQWEDEEEEDIPLSDIQSLASDERGDLIPHQRLTINNHAALTAAVNRFALPLSSLQFSSHQSITTSEPVSVEDVDDDLNRELAFYAQSLSAVKEARKLLKAEALPFSRPVDYFAEMVKSEEHMGRVKQRLRDDAASKKAASEARKQRDLKKFGKAVQVAKQQERAKEKRETLDKINTLKRKRSNAVPTAENEPDMFDIALDTETKKPRRSDGANGAGKGGPNAKRQKKNEKYGFGGKKRHSKSNDAFSSSDMRGSSTKGQKGKPTGASKRLGKARRAKAKA